jgi:REP element-mobilizing transposase RayT
MSRCVRQAFLCGQDPISGKSFEHRRAWVENRILLLADVMCIGVLSYAVMNNHTHLVLYIDKEQENDLSDLNVLQRWAKIRRLPDYALAYIDDEQRPMLCEQELNRVQVLVAEYRERLLSISWFMSLLNYYIARKANKEDGCKGRFWEGRFKSQALLDQQAVLSCMAYVDMNPIRAGMCSTLAKSEFTSVKHRMRRAKSLKNCRMLPLSRQGVINSNSCTAQLSLFDYVQYLRLLSQRDIVDDDSLLIGNIQLCSAWQRQSLVFEREFSYVAGSKTDMEQFRLRMRVSGQNDKPGKARLGV